jgi:RNA polymerase sigma-70 factor, ECF subfamily
MAVAIKERPWPKLQYPIWMPAGSFARRATEVNPPQTTVKDLELLQRIGARDRHAFILFYERYSTVLYSMAVRILNDPEQAAEVLHEVFVQVWENSGSYNSDFGKPFSWVLALTRNRAIGRLRASNGQYRFADEVAHEMAEDAHRNLHEQAISHEEALLIRSAIATLPVEQRQAIEMAFLGGLTQQEISQSTGQPLGTIKARIRRGMLKLRQELQGVA